MSSLQSIARFKIHPGKLEEFKNLAKQCLQLVREKDKGTLRYTVFFNEDETECLVYEEYVDSDASIQHFKNMGGVANAIFKTADVTGEIWGNPNEAVQKNIDGKTLRLFTPFISLEDDK